MSSAKTPVLIYDTTLRDGTQGEGISFSAEDKLRVAQLMDAMGFDYIEGGWPGSNPRDMAFFELARELKFTHAKLAAFGSTRRANLAAEADPQLATLVAAQTPVVTIFGKTWLLHVTEVIRTTAEENLAMIEDSVRFLVSQGREVIYDAEHFFDGFKDNPDYALATLAAAERGGASCLTLCDTNGGTMVTELQAIVRRVVERFPQTRVGMHCHNDCGLGVALSLAGVEAGASLVQGTMNGYGERVGNADLTSIVPSLALKLGYPVHCAPNLPRWRQFSLDVDHLAELEPNAKAPWVGRSAFAHKGGVHANAAQKVARSYEHVVPESVGNRQRILLSDMAGGSSVAMKAAELGYPLDAKHPRMAEFIRELKDLEHQGYEFERADASFELLLHRFFSEEPVKEDFSLVSYRIISEVVRKQDEVISEAVIKLQVNGDDEIHLAIAEAAGPVGALDQAARRAFGTHFPELQNVQLIDYRVRILVTGAGTNSVVQVLVNSTDGVTDWWTCGASPNILEASWQALRDAYRFKRLKHGQAAK